METAVHLGDDGDRNDLPFEVSDETTHQIFTDPWYQVGFVLTTGINGSYILGYSASIMAPLGWIGVLVGMLVVAAVSFYANIIISRLHNIGGKRPIRYKDLAGRKMYYLTCALQYVNLCIINIGYIILAGQALKAISVLYWHDGAMKLPYCIAIAGVACAPFALRVPNLSAFRIWLTFSTILSLVYIAIPFVLSHREGLNSQMRDYCIATSHWEEIAICAVANLVFTYNTGMLPEIQAKILNTSSFAGARVNWKETLNAHVFKFDLPGMSSEEIKVEVEDESVLQIRGERKRENEKGTDTWHRLECSSGTFLRRFHLPANAILAKAEVSLENSILTVFVPKALPKKIGIRSLNISIPVYHPSAAF